MRTSLLIRFVTNTMYICAPKVLTIILISMLRDTTLANMPLILRYTYIHHTLVSTICHTTHYHTNQYATHIIANVLRTYTTLLKSI